MTCATESDEQKTVVEWAQWNAAVWPELHLLFAVPNGGYRHPATAGRLRDEGVRSGVPDLVLPVARRGYHSLFLETKRVRGGRVTPNQLWWLHELKRNGHAVVVCKGANASNRRASVVRRVTHWLPRLRNGLLLQYRDLGDGRVLESLFVAVRFRTRRDVIYRGEVELPLRLREETT